MAEELAQYYIAVDGGASKTRFCLHHIQSGAERHFYSSGTNFKNPEINAKKNLIDDGLCALFSEAGIAPAQVRGLVMGLSGCDSEEDARYFKVLVQGSGVAPDRIYIGNDCELAFYSQGTPPGLCVVAGTGSIAFGIAADNTKARCGGWGSIASDEGSGLWMGATVARELLRYCDGRGPNRPFFERLRKHMNEPAFPALPARISELSVKEMAGFARLTLEAAEEGDSFCANVSAQATGLVAELARSVYDKMRFALQPRVDLVMIGSLFKSDLFREGFRRDIAAGIPRDNIRFIEGASPVAGGLALAQKLFGEGK